ncbi:Eco57I restriction-modification methylase domain-containing protein [Gracilibacillus dipsosauri]|uniref:Eco57I restriction-modification methylase domain-containing protein n=1 Tax=Gracilibacillus dipsosauri TaxID=178340 RepID=UPI002409830F
MAIDLTGITNVNEFYSHHYLDSLLEGDLKGLYKKWAETDDRSPYEKLSGIANRYFKAKTDGFNEKKPEDRIEITRKFHINFLEALGYKTNQVLKYSEDGQAIPLITSEKRDGNEYLWVLETVFWSDDISVFEQPLVLENNQDEISWFNDTIDMAIQHIFRLGEPPRWLVLLAGQKAYLIDRNKWGQGKYLLFDLDELFGRKQAETLKATAALLSKDALAPEEGNVLHDELDENSHKHAFSVSEDLKFGIRRAVELIGNEFIHYRSKVAKQKIYGDEELANKLTKESLTYLYRLLFLFYAESRSEELNVVPMKSEEYRLGYSLETLRELEQVPLTTESSREGYFLHESLTTLFKIVNDGFGYDDQYEIDYESGKYVDIGFDIEGLQSPLFDPKETPLLSSVKFRNFVLQEVIQLLSLSKEGSKQRGRISYAQLGINQLGAVYEGLLSYSGFFAQETLYEVKPANVSSTDETGQSYFVPESVIEQYKEDEFVRYQDNDGNKNRKKYQKGSFIFRLAGRDREKSASYYTPEVLTKSLVKYSLKELLKDKTADEILELTICEPAMGSGAFLNETLNQLADSYLEKKQNELEETIDPNNYTNVRQRVKAYLANNNIYGVDLNPTAIELAKISLWLNTIYDGAKTPWFSGRLTVGNSLIGARLKTFNENELMSGKWHNIDPISTGYNDNRKNGHIYHFLIPDKNMMNFDKDKSIKDVAQDSIKLIRNWRKDFIRNFESDELKSLENISFNIDELLNRYKINRLKILNEITEPINLWKMESDSESRHFKIEYKDKLLWDLKKSPTAPYRILKLIMDYWCALWFWPIDKVNLLPSRDEFILDLSVIIDSSKGFGQNIDELINSVDRLSVVEEVSRKIPFLHWELEFPEVFANKNGFDLIVGNPPWINVSFDESGVIGDVNPLINLRKFSAAKVTELKKDSLKNPVINKLYIDEYSQQAGLKEYLGAKVNYPLMRGKVNLYKGFINLGWRIGNKKGILALVHPEGIYEDPKGGKLRKEIFQRLIYHFQFVNELKLFAEIGNLNKYSLNIYTCRNRNKVKFENISNLFHPKTIDECFNHSGEGEVPGYKNKEFNWELGGHKRRIITVNEQYLKLINRTFQGTSDEYIETMLPTIHSEEIVKVLDKIVNAEKLYNNTSFNISPSSFWNETNSQRDGTIERKTEYPNNLEEFVFSGPHFFVGTPFYQTPNEGCKNHRDYSPIKLMQIEEDYIPRTNYMPACSKAIFLSKIPRWNGRLLTDYYRLILRKQLNISGERTFISSIIPKGATQINSTITIAFNDERELLLFSGYSHSIIVDAFVKMLGRANLYESSLKSLPFINSDKVNDFVISRTLRLNCLTNHYNDLWKDNFKSEFLKDSFSKPNSKSWDHLSEKWTQDTPFRTDLDRRQALLEIDVLSALALGLSIDDLITLYRVQFPVLQKYESQNHYDQVGRLVDKETLNYYMKNNGNVEIQDDSLNGLIPPFEKYNREADMRQAYEYFSNILKIERKVKP